MIGKTLPPLLVLCNVWAYFGQPKMMFTRMTIRRQLVIRGVLFEVVVVLGGKSIVLAE